MDPGCSVRVKLWDVVTCEFKNLDIVAEEPELELCRFNKLYKQM